MGKVAAFAVFLLDRLMHDSGLVFCRQIRMALRAGLLEGGFGLLRRGSAPRKKNQQNQKNKNEIALKPHRSRTHCS